MTPTPNARLLPVLFLGTLTAALDIALVGPSLPAVEQALNLDARSSAWLLGAFVLANLTGLPFTARAADIFGRRVVFITSLVGLAIGAFTVFMAPTYPVVIAGRVLQGLSASGLFPAASAVVADTIPPERRGRALGLLGAVFGVAFLIGPITAGILIGVASWRWVFAVPIPIALITAVWSWWVLPRTYTRMDRKFDAVGAFLLGASLLSIGIGLNQLDTLDLVASAISLKAAGLVVLGLLLMGAFLWHESRTPDPILNLGLLRRRTVAMAGAYSFGAGLIEAIFIFLSAFAVTAYAVPRSQASYMLIPLVLAVMIGAPVTGRGLDRVGPRVIVGMGCALATAGLVGLVYASGTVAGYYLSTITLGFGLSALLGSSLTYLVLYEAEPSERGIAQGVVTLFLSVGQLLGAAFIGASVASQTGTQGFHAAFLGAAGLALLLTVMALRLPDKKAGEAVTSSAPA